MKKNKILPALLLAAIVSTSCLAQTAKLEEAINTYVNQYKFTGTVLVARHGEIILQKGYGFKDAATGTPNTVNTIYEIGSLAKQFTAAVILKLQEQGKLSVHDKLSKYYPGYPNGDKITIHYLLSHSAGIYNYTNNKAFMSGDQSKPVTLDSMIGLFINQPLAFEPGTKFSYSNSGYTLLGYIIEKVTGRPYREALETMILRPLQLKHSGYDFIALTDSNKATGYSYYAPGAYEPARYVHPSILYTTGALYSTVGDLYKWHWALMTNDFLSAASRQMMYTPVAGPYGYGWFADSLFGKKRASHDGAVPGFKSNINRIPEDDVCVIALSNSNGSSVGQMVRVLMCILYDQPYQLPVERKDVKLDTAVLKQYTGRYDFGPQTTTTITLENDMLYIQGGGLRKTELFAASETSFFGKTIDISVEFVKDSQAGIVSQVIIYADKQKYTGKKAN